MSQELGIADFMDASSDRPIFDVRSPGEYGQGHIPGAHNIPLFDDGERAVVGKLYKKAGRGEALKKGLEFVGPKMRKMVEEVESVAGGRGALVHCWRGGMRSSSFAWLLETSGIETTVLKDGYKAFRNFVLDLFEQQYPLVVLGGFTGSGKTELLDALREAGEQVIDLEGLANHRGSAFGHLGEGRQPTGEQFQNELGQRLYRVDPARPVWVEDESQQVGARIIPGGFYDSMRAAPLVRLDLPRHRRIARLVRDYGKFELEDLKVSILKIKKRLGGLRTQQALQALEDGKLEKVAEIILGYYDKTYSYGLGKRDQNRVKKLTLDSDDASRNIRYLLDETREWLNGKMEREGVEG